ncbi:MAG TPA: hypothetical protein VFG10_07320 [Saprospiraceae bacterium]|nr:hypothetical protein [Saprospiraceae bacterium]
MNNLKEIISKLTLSDLKDLQSFIAISIDKKEAEEDDDELSGIVAGRTRYFPEEYPNIEEFSKIKKEEKGKKQT